jgi:hypothetical protein
LKTYISNPKKEITPYLLWDSPKLDFYVLDDGPIKDAQHQKLINTKIQSITIWRIGLLSVPSLQRRK